MSDFERIERASRRDLLLMPAGMFIGFSVVIVIAYVWGVA